MTDTKRTLADVNNNYFHACARLGEKHYAISVIRAQVATYQTRIQDLKTDCVGVQAEIDALKVEADALGTAEAQKKITDSVNSMKETLSTEEAVGAQC